MSDHHRLAAPSRIGDRRQAGGGGGGPPTRNPSRHGQKLTEDLSDALSTPRSPVAEGVDPRHVFKVRAASRVADSGWSGRGLEPLGESTEGWTYFVLTSDAAGTELAADLARYAAGPDQDGAKADLSSVFGLIEDVRPYGREDREGPGLDGLDLRTPTLVDVELWPSPDREEAARRLAEVATVIEQTEGEVLVQDARPQFSVARVRVNEQGLDALLDLPVVERVRTPPEPFLEPSDWLRAQAEDLQTLVEDGEPVGVIDDGIVGSHPLLQGVLVGSISVPDDTYFTSPPSAHGTMVAGLAAYGDFAVPLRDGTDLVAKPIYGARVLEPHPTHPGRTRFPESVLEHVATEEAIRRLHASGVRVFNMSITDEFAYSGPHVSIWTESIDALIRELGIVVVVSTGNVPASLGGQAPDGSDYRRGYPTYCLVPDARIAEPGVAALAMTAGSVARSAGPATPAGVSHVGSRGIAKVGEVSPFSRTGPGFSDSGTVKPEVVDFGGNWVLTDSGSLDVQNPGVSVVTLSADPGRRLFTIGNGTSFSAPRVARVAADVWYRYPDSSANLIRALVSLSARIPEGVRPADNGDRLRAFGHGRPAVERATESGGNRTVLVYEGLIPVDDAVVHAIPVPEEFARGRSPRRIRVAIAFDPPVRRQRREYLAGQIKVDLVRNMDLAEIADIFSAQDTDDATPLPRNRRRPDLVPGTNSFTKSTVLVREWLPKQLNVDDGDTYYLVVTHRMAPWANQLSDAYTEQSYAVAVELADEGRVDLDLHELVRPRVELPTEVAVRARG